MLMAVAGCGGGHAPHPPATPSPPSVPAAVAPIAVVAPVAPADVRLPRTFQVESYAPSLVIDPASPTFTGTLSNTASASGPAQRA